MPERTNSRKSRSCPGDGARSDGHDRGWTRLALLGSGPACPSYLTQGRAGWPAYAPSYEGYHGRGVGDVCREHGRSEPGAMDTSMLLPDDSPRGYSTPTSIAPHR